MDAQGRVPAVEVKRRGAGQGEETAKARRNPPGPTPRQRTVSRQQPALKAMGADCIAGEEIDQVVQWPAALERERPEIRPDPGRVDQSKRQINQRRYGREPHEELERLIMR